MKKMATKNLTIKQYLALSNLEPEIKSVLVQALEKQYSEKEEHRELLLELIEPIDGNLFQKLRKIGIPLLRKEQNESK